MVVGPRVDMGRTVVGRLAEVVPMGGPTDELAARAAARAAAREL